MAVLVLSKSHPVQTARGTNRGMFRNIPWTLFLVLQGVLEVMGHGRLWEPPSRSSMWRLGYNTTINTDDNELSCGGFTNQWLHYGGKCGICGDPFQQRPRDNEYGGMFASGWITRTYPIGGVMDVIVDLTANHAGYFEFRLCPTDKTTGADPAKCPDSNKLKIVNGESNGYRYYIRDPTLDGHIRLQVALPNNVMCTHCLFQWKYHTATRWGCDHELRCEKGIGPQEEFYGCSDISIENVSSTVYRDPIYFLNQKKTDNSFATTQPNSFLISPETKGYLNDVGTMISNKPYSQPYSPTQNSKPVKTEDSFTKYIHQIILDAAKKHYMSGMKINQPVRTECKAAPAFAKNPIVHEWCHRTCQQRREMCQSHMCVCKTTSMRPSQKMKLPFNVINHGDEAHVFKSLGMDKDEFVSFVRRVLKTYRSARTPPENKPITTRVPNFIAKQEIPRRSKIFYIDFPDRKENLHAPTPSYDKHLSTKLHVGKNIKRILPTNSDLDPKVEDHRNLSNDIFASPGRKMLTCIASKDFAHNKYMSKWCMRNCPFGFCPKSVCACI